MKKIVLAGGSGNIGQSLSQFLVELGYTVLVLSRTEQKKSGVVSYVEWDGEHVGAWTSSLEGADAIINLSGKSIQCRFTAENKKELIDSRILSTKVIGEAIQTLVNPPRLWVNFSGISIFEGVDSLNDENSENYGFGFLAELTELWEKTFFEVANTTMKQVVLRVSPVLSRDYGMFKELYPLVKLGLGGQVGNGQQMISWIHELDLLRMVGWILTLENPSSIYHACVPDPSSNADFMKALRAEVGVSLGLPLPTILAKIGAFVKGVDSGMLLNSNDVGTTKTQEDGFGFLYPEINQAFKQLLNK